MKNNNKTLKQTIVWHDAKRDPPKESGFYLTMSNYRWGDDDIGYSYSCYIQPSFYSKVHGKWNVSDFAENTDTAIDYDMWAKEPVNGRKIDEFLA